MPTYQYRCKECSHDFEIVQAFTDDALTKCPECKKKALKKVYGNVGISFKGSGFYKNDARKSSSSKSSTSSSETGSGSTSDSSKAEKKSEKKSESKTSGDTKKSEKSSPSTSKSSD